MLYYRSLEYGLSKLPEADPQIRAQIEDEAAIHGWEAIHQQLKEVDPESAQRIHPNDPQRLQRALEVYRLTGVSLSQHWMMQQDQALNMPLIKIALAPQERATLHQRIEQRFEWMLQNGLIKEVETLFAREDLNDELPSIRCVGYRQVWHYLQGKIDYDEMRFRGIAATRQLAKRQFTWLRKENQVNWFDSLAANLHEKVLKYMEINGV
jgi:tRNA dimethylallyltransferase